MTSRMTVVIRSAKCVTPRTTVMIRVHESRGSRKVAYAPPTTRSKSAQRKELGGRPFGAEEAVGWSVGRQMIEPGQWPPRSQLET